MPFDGVLAGRKTKPDDGVFPSLWASGSRLWIRTRLLKWGYSETPTLAFSPAAYYAVVAMLLEDAKTLIERPATWGQGAYRGFWRRRCAVGALCAAARKVSDVRVVGTAHSLLLTVADSRRYASVEAMNDLSSHAEVISAFNEAIALAWGKALPTAIGGELARQ